jgi:hypothetical protein
MHINTHDEERKFKLIIATSGKLVDLYIVHFLFVPLSAYYLPLALYSSGCRIINNSHKALGAVKIGAYKNDNNSLLCLHVCD